MRSSGQDSAGKTTRRRAITGAVRSLGSWREMVIIDETAKEPSVVARVSTWRFAVMVFAIAGAMTIYIGHVYKSQDLLNDLQAERRENLRLHLHHNGLVGQYNEAIGPAVIYERAPDVGLKEGYDFAATIRDLTSESTTSAAP